MGKEIDFITGEKFMAMADYTYAPIVRHQDDYCKLKSTLNVLKLKDGDIIYTHTFYVKQLFKLLEGLPVKVKVITHNSDMNITEDFIVPDNVITWYAQNLDMYHDRVEPIPIGLENEMWFPQLRKKERMLEYMGFPREFENLVYMNFNISTNFAERSVCYKALEDKPWVTVSMANNGYHYLAYLRHIQNHKFVVCPPGNGIDTHRIWETLYMGSIPIVLNTPIAEQLYTYYPCVVVDSWDEITVDLLTYEFLQIEETKSWFSSDYRLSFEYWKEKIRQDDSTDIRA